MNNWNKQPDEMPLVGPSSDEREPAEMSLDDIRLSGGRPLYHALLENPEAVNLSAFETEKAKSRLQDLAWLDKKVVFSCNGKTIDEARAILESIEKSSGQQAA